MAGDPLLERLRRLLRREPAVPALPESASLAVPARWLRTPDILAGDRVCLFVALARAGRLLPHSLRHARAWADAGFKTVVVAVMDGIAHDPQGDLGFAAGVLVRDNQGYDFGAWAATIGRLPGVRRAALLALANDSVFGPLDSFSAMLARLAATPADVIGATDSFEAGHHLQSYLLFFRQKALTSPAFAAFWGNVETGGRSFVIHKYELRLLLEMQRAGLQCRALFPADPADPRNPTLTHWRALIERGFPYVKVQLLRDNPLGADLTGWDRLLAGRGYDPAQVRELLAERHALPPG